MKINLEKNVPAFENFEKHLKVTFDYIIADNRVARMKKKPHQTICQNI